MSAQPLPRGRHKLPAEAVRASQRERLLNAMEQLVAERGYEATSVPRVTAAAHVSTNAFYTLFRDKADCFIALCERTGAQLLEALVPGGAPWSDAGDALGALDEGIAVYLRWWSDRPGMARSYFVELPSAGVRAMEERDRQYERFAALYRAIGDQARRIDPQIPPLRDVEVRAALVVVTELVGSEVRAGRVEQLAELHDDLRHVLLKLLVGDAALGAIGRR